MYFTKLGGEKTAEKNTTNFGKTLMKSLEFIIRIIKLLHTGQHISLLLWLLLYGIY